MTAFASLIAFGLESRNIPQTAISERTKLKPPMVSLIVNGKRLPDYAYVDEIADVCGIDHDALREAYDSAKKAALNARRKAQSAA